MMNPISFRFSFLKHLLLSAIFLSLVFYSSVPLVFAATGEKVMVATAAPQATNAALQILRRGGNAVDAAIAAQWVLNVVEPQSSGIGGGAFFLYYEARTRRIFSFDGREAAPADAFPEMFLDETGKPYPFRPDRITGGLPVGVPGVLKLLKEMHEKYSSKNFSFSALFQPAIEIAEKGFPISERLAHHLDREQSRLRLFPASKMVYFENDKAPYQEGDILFQKDLARTFRVIQANGVDEFYQGEIAEAIVKAVRSAPFHPGFLKMGDLKDYRVKERPVLSGTYRGYEVFAMGPPSSGGTTLIETLNILENFDLNFYRDKTDRYHLLSEAQRLAFEDRAKFLGDPDFSEVPVARLISKKFAEERSAEIQADYAMTGSRNKLRASMQEGTHTSHVSIVDAQGNMVAFTTTIEDVFGSAMVVPGWGIVLNNELTDFDAEPFVKNTKQTKGKSSERLLRNPGKALHPNAPEGDKRPRSSMTPTFVFNQGKPFLILGSPGGSTIIGTVLNIVVNVIDFRMELLAAVRAPKLLNREGVTELEPPLYQNQTLRRALEKRGHKVVEKSFFGNAQVIHFDEFSGTIHGESDPRGEGLAKGY